MAPIVICVIDFLFRRHLHQPEDMSLVCASPDLIEAAGILVTVQDVNYRDKAKSHDTAGSGAGAQDETTSEGKCMSHVHVHPCPHAESCSCFSCYCNSVCVTLHDV